MIHDDPGKENHLRIPVKRPSDLGAMSLDLKTGLTETPAFEASVADDAQLTLFIDGTGTGEKILRYRIPGSARDILESIVMMYRERADLLDGWPEKLPSAKASTKDQLGRSEVSSLIDLLVVREVFHALGETGTIIYAESNVESSAIESLLDCEIERKTNLLREDIGDLFPASVLKWLMETGDETLTRLAIVSVTSANRPALEGALLAASDNVDLPVDVRRFALNRSR